MFSRAMTRRIRIGSGTALNVASVRVRSRVVVVLFTSVGQRVDIVRAFRAAGAVALGVDADPFAPALYHCDLRVIVPRIADPAYVPRLAGLVREHEVGLVVPLNDLDFPVLARERDELAPALVLLPDAEVSARMSDKLDAHRFFVEIGIPSPRSWAPDEVPGDARFPVLVKAREGFGSRNIFRAHDADELAFFLSYTGSRRSCRRRAWARSSRSTSSATWTAAA